jgi:bifunctional DNA-binding transcriptional regulator/antitoxin component of YhaV-PrlF toxin-antitoxin module|tara:strand:+ start:329 stop:505 length:177 start_codon:yes stop_codon:yes gene_type:complete
MQKNSEENFTDIKVNPVTDEYYVTVPEWVINEFGWYEDTVVEWVIDGNELFLKEVKND